MTVLAKLSKSGLPAGGTMKFSPNFTSLTATLNAAFGAVVVVAASQSSSEKRINEKSVKRKTMRHTPRVFLPAPHGRMHTLSFENAGTASCFCIFLLTGLYEPPLTINVKYKHLSFVNVISCTKIKSMNTVKYFVIR